MTQRQIAAMVTTIKHQKRATYRLKKERYKLQNTFKFVGVISEIIPPRRIISNERSHLIRMIIVQEFKSPSKIVSEMVLQLPDTFLISKIEPLVNSKINCEFAFYSKVVRSNGNCFSVLNLLSIRPIEQAKWLQDLTQVLKRRRFRETLLPPTVDEDGYRYPYTY